MKTPSLFIKVILFSFLIILVATSCSNNDDDDQNPINQLPPETQTGANTFGFLVNGEVVNVRNTSQQTAILQGGGLQFGAGGIFIAVLEPFTTDTAYEFMDLGQGISRVRYFVDPDPQLGCHYNFEDTYQGSVIFTKIDRTNFIISGRFEFSTVNSDCENIDITNGRFDLQYIP